MEAKIVYGYSDVSNSCNPTCPPIRQTPVWPSNSPNELLYYNQRLFNRDNHNHDQVLGEKTFNLPLMLPENQARAPFTYCNGTTGEMKVAPYSTDNIMHQNWKPFRMLTNVNIPYGSDANIYFEDVPPAEVNTNYLDWLDKNSFAAAASLATGAGKSQDEKVYDCCGAQGENGMVCSMTCVDWWTNRPIPPQGILTQPDGSGGGCPWNTVQALSCYPCDVHNTYVRGK